MMISDNFSDNTDNNLAAVFTQTNVPIFQNKVYPSYEQAIAAEKGEVRLMQSLISGFVFNKSFQPHIMNYDMHYQNEQANSMIFQEHLNEVLRLLKKFDIAGKKVIEVGCGKGVFFEKMLEEGIDCWGFDPTYEGNSSRIKKEYFDETQKDIMADVIIMRHTLEHITQPFSFLHTIARANNYKGFLFVEVPTFDWIVEKKAFWDIFYEHCNYFTRNSLANMFTESVTGSYFGGQYIYLWADLSKIRSTIPPDLKFPVFDTSAFEAKLKIYESMLAQSGSFAVWGAGAKGSTFLNLLDAQRNKVDFVIDINPAKQNKFIAGTGHIIYSPEILSTRKVENILIMNENYADEIYGTLKKNNISVNTIIL